MEANASGKFTFTERLDSNGNATTLTADGTFSVDSDCIVHVEFTLPGANGAAGIPIKLRGILVDEGREILAIDTDPALVLSARFSAR